MAAALVRGRLGARRDPAGAGHARRGALHPYRRRRYDRQWRRVVVEHQRTCGGPAHRSVRRARPFCGARRLRGGTRPPAHLRWLGRHRGRLAGISILTGEAGVTPTQASEVRQTLKTTVTEYEYSDLDELTVERIPGVDTTSYAYDAMGNRTSETKRGGAKACVWDGADRRIAAGGVTSAYDANASRASRTSGSQSTSYAFDHEDRLIAVSGPTGLSQYDYDGLGRRIRSQEGGITRRYVVDVTAKPYRTLADESGAGTLE